MTVLSILSCKILQDEIIWLIANDSQIKRIRNRSKWKYF